MATRSEIVSADIYILYERMGREIMTYRQAKDCANAVVVHPAPDRLMVRGLTRGKQTFRMTAVEFGMTIFD